MLHKRFVGAALVAVAVVASSLYVIVIVLAWIYLMRRFLGLL